MSNALSSIGNFFSSPTFSTIGKLAGLGTAGLGLAGNISAGRQQGKELDYLRAQQDKWANMTPQEMSRLVAGATRPLDNSLIQMIQNSTSGQLAEMGLSQAPGIQAATLAQALAPYQQQNQSQALQQILAQMKVPTDYASVYLANTPKPTDLSTLISGIFSGGNPAATAAANPSSNSNWAGPTDEDIFSQLYGGIGA